MPANYTPEEISDFLEQFFNVVGTRQYIGARYVPMFGRQGEESIEWDNSAPYEPLTIVLYQGDSYTSRTYVPTGALLTDTRYWVETGNYSGQIEAYREEVLAFDGRITDVEEGLSSEIQNRTTADTALQNLAINRGSVVILIGDSYAEGYTPDGTVVGWVERARQYLAKAGITAKTGYQGGSAFANGHFLTILQSIVSNMTADEKNRCTTVVIGGCYNDHGQSEANVRTGVENVANYVRTNLKNATCRLITVGRCVTGLTTGLHVDTTMNSVKNAAINWYVTGTENGMQVDLTGLACLNENSLFSSDFVHPKAEGNIRIARHVVNLILGSNLSTHRLGNVSESSADVVGANGWTYYGSQKQVLIGTDAYGFATGFTFGTTADGYIEFRRETPLSHTFGATNTLVVGTIHKAAFCGTNTVVPVLCVLHNSPSGYATANGVLSINDAGNITLQCIAINSDGNNYLSMNLDRIQIRPCYYIFH